MDLQFFKQAATPNRVDKSSFLESTGELSGVKLKEETDLMHPVFILKTNPIVYNSNYLYCTSTGRYYYIDKITAMSGKRIAIECSIDVLYTYKNEILASSGWVESSASVDDESTEAYNMMHNDYPFREDYDILGVDLVDSDTPFGGTIGHSILLVIK